MFHRKSSIARSTFFPTAVKRGAYARCLIKITIIWAFRVVVMRPKDRLSAAVHVPDNRAASIIPLPTAASLTPLPPPPSHRPRSVIKTKLYGIAVASRSASPETSVLVEKEVWTTRSQPSDGLSSSDFYGCKFEHGLRKPVARSCRRNSELLATFRCNVFSRSCHVMDFIIATDDNASPPEI